MYLTKQSFQKTKIQKIVLYSDMMAPKSRVTSSESHECYLEEPQSDVDDGCNCDDRCDTDEGHPRNLQSSMRGERRKSCCCCHQSIPLVSNIKRCYRLLSVTGAKNGLRYNETYSFQSKSAGRGEKKEMPPDARGLLVVESGVPLNR
jgi:hypothetical protein